MSEHEKTRYSDEELLEFKKIIKDKLEKAKAEFAEAKKYLEKMIPMLSDSNATQKNWNS